MTKKAGRPIDMNSMAQNGGTKFILWLTRNELKKLIMTAKQMNISKARVIRDLIDTIGG